MILKLLYRLERNPQATFQRQEVMGLDPLIRDHLLRTVYSQSNLIRSGRLLMLSANEGGTFEALDEEDPDYHEHLSPDDLTLFTVDLGSLASMIRSGTGLTGPSGRLSERLFLLGERSDTEGVVLALFPDSRSAVAGLKALPVLASSSYRRFDVVCPTVAIPVAELRPLQSLGIHASVMEEDEPFHLYLAKEDGEGAVNVDFWHSEDYTSVTIRGFRFTLSSPQAGVVKYLDEARLQRTPDVEWKSLASRLPTAPRNMSDVFKGLPNWRELVAQPRRNRYRLNLD